MDFESAVKRINLMKGHVNPSLEAIRERKLATFDVEKAKKALWSLLPDSYFWTFEALANFEDHPVKEVCLKYEDKELSRKEGNEFIVNLISGFYKAGNLSDPDEMIDRLDEILAGITSSSFYDGATFVKLSKILFLNQ